MANIHDLLVKYDSTSPREGLFPIDLNCGDPEVNKIITAGIYDLSQDPPEKVSTFVGSDTKMLTRIEDCDGSYVLVENTLGEVQELVVMLCDVCLDTNGGNQLGASCDKPMNTKDCDREALIAMLQTQIDELVKIFGAVDGLELTTENIRIEAGQINLNTDQVETLLTQINDLITLKGSDCSNALFVKDCGTQDLLDKLQDVIDAINSTSTDEQAILTSIDTKLDELVLIKDELVKANTTLDGIKVDSSLINDNLEVVIEKLDTQITALEDLKALVTDTNVKLDTANATLTTISAEVALIKSDIATIKSDISEIKTDVKAVITKLDSVIASLTTIEGKLDDVILGLETINTTLQTEFDQTQDKLDDLIEAVNATKAGKVQDLISWVASAGQTATIPSGKFSTMALFASKGEFRISNETNNFLSDITFSGGTQSAFIEISEDGVGTATGATSTPQAIDTRTNANDMDLANNSFLITCVRDGVLSLELYK